VSALFIITGLSLATVFAGWPPVYNRNKSSTLLLRIETAVTGPGYGSAIVVSNDGLVLTARHVLPDDGILSTDQFRISGLLGWEKPSIDFNQAIDLEVKYTSKSKDLAVLKFKTPMQHTQIPCPEKAIQATEPLLLMAYPNGGNLTSTDGIASGAAPDGLYRSNLESGKGESGGPIFNANGSLIGILLSGNNRTNDGAIILAYFLPTQAISDDLASNFPSVVLQCGPAEAAAPSARPEAFDFGYSLEETKEAGVGPNIQSYRRSFTAQEGYHITTARFVVSSTAHVRNGPSLEIAEAGARVDVSFTLESESDSQPRRAWLAGKVLTHQTQAR
jgi:hypothetical protein